MADEKNTEYKNLHCVDVKVPRQPKGFELIPAFGKQGAGRLKQFVLPTEEYGPIVFWLSQSSVKESDLAGFNRVEKVREDLPEVNLLVRYPFLRELNEKVRKVPLKMTISFTEKTQDGQNGERVTYRTMSEDQFNNMAVVGEKSYNEKLAVLSLAKERHKKAAVHMDDMIPEEHDAHEEKDSFAPEDTDSI